MASSKSVAAFLMMLNLAMFAFVSTNALDLGSGLGGLGSGLGGLGGGLTRPSKPGGSGSCPNLNVCVDILGSLVEVQVGDPHPRDSQCCKRLGLVDLHAAACLCTNLKTNNGLFNAVGAALGIAKSLLGGLTGPILDKQILAIIKTCELKAPEDYKCLP